MGEHTLNVYSDDLKWWNMIGKWAYLEKSSHRKCIKVDLCRCDLSLLACSSIVNIHEKCFSQSFMNATLFCSSYNPHHLAWWNELLLSQASVTLLGAVLHRSHTNLGCDAYSECMHAGNPGHVVKWGNAAFTLTLQRHCKWQTSHWTSRSHNPGGFWEIWSIAC